MIAKWKIISSLEKMGRRKWGHNLYFLFFGI
jgi:hypothetical protein